MGNNFAFRTNFIEQIKIDSKGQSKILGIYINPNEFPKGGLIIVSERAIHNYNPIYGTLNTSYSFNRTVLFSDYNRKSKDGSILTCVTDDMKCYFISTENLTVNKIVNIMTKMNLRIKDGSKISCINFHLNDALLLACSDGSVIKCRLNDEPVNLLYEISGNKFKTPEDEFESIKNVFSSDTAGESSANLLKDEEVNEYITSMLISDRYKVLFCIQKPFLGTSKVILFNLRNNTYMHVFCKINGLVKCACLDDRKDLLIVVNFSPETKKSILEFWSYFDQSCPISTFDLSSLLEYKFTVSSIYLTTIPNIFYGRNSISGKLEGDILAMGSTKGDIIVGTILSRLQTNNKPGYEHFMVYKLNNSKTFDNDDYSNQFEISFISYDLNFDVVYVGDISSNVRFIEKILQVGRKEKIEENLPLFSINYEPSGKGYITDGKRLIKNPYIPKANYDLPVISMNHDIIKDRNIILYDKGKDIKVKKYQASSLEDNDSSDFEDEDGDERKKEKREEKDELTQFSIKDNSILNNNKE